MGNQPLGRPRETAGRVRTERHADCFCLREAKEDVSMCRLTRLVTVVLVFTCAIPAGAATDPNVRCHKKVVKQLEKFKKTHLKLYRNCLDKENKGKLAGPCLDGAAVAKLALTNTKVTANIAKK